MSRFPSNPIPGVCLLLSYLICILIYAFFLVSDTALCLPRPSWLYEWVWTLPFWFPSERMFIQWSGTHTHSWDKVMYERVEAFFSWWRFERWGSPEPWRVVPRREQPRGGSSAPGVPRRAAPAGGGSGPGPPCWARNAEWMEAPGALGTCEIQPCALG